MLQFILLLSLLIIICFLINSLKNKYNDYHKLELEKNDLLRQKELIENDLKNKIDTFASEKKVLIDSYEQALKLKDQIIEEKNKTFNEQLSNVMKNELKTFQTANDNTKADILKENSKQIKQIIDETNTALNKQINQHNVMIQDTSKSVSKIINAFAGSSSAGKFGEGLLKSKLESLGMRENENFLCQFSAEYEGKGYRLDYVILLPENQFIIIDSKVSTSMLDQESDNNIKKIAEAIKKQIEGYAQKTENYLLATANTLKVKFNTEYNSNLSYCLMYLPSEKIVEELYQYDYTIFQKASKNAIIICGPTSLTNILHITQYNIQTAKNQINFQENVEKIVNIAKSFLNIAEDFVTIGKNIEKLDESYNLIINRWNKNISKPIELISKEFKSHLNATNIKKLETISEKNINIKTIDNESPEDI